MTHNAHISKFYSHCPCPSSELDNSLSRCTHCVTPAHQTSSRYVQMKHDSVSLPVCQAMEVWRYGRKTPLTKFVVITMVLVKIPVFYSMVPCRLVDCLQASLLASSSRYLHSVISQKTGIFQN